MKPKLLHQQAMDFSFQAKQVLAEGNFADSFELYKQAADVESEVANFYFDKPELEPTRSIIIRSAAFLNLKAGLFENAQKYIFFGLLNTKDELIKEQLNNALELYIFLKTQSPEDISREFNYYNLLKQRSVHYVLEPTEPKFGHSVSLEMVKDFIDGYLKSLKAFATSKYRKLMEITGDVEASVVKELDKLINPLLTNASQGSFKFSVANDFLTREGEDEKLTKLKSTVVTNFHNEIFINPLSENDIGFIKENYTDEEVNDIFRPLTKIKSHNKPYKIGYFDSENLNKIYVNKIINKQKKELLTVSQISQDDIGELESSITHKRSSSSGKITKKTILKEQLKSYEFEIKTNVIEPKESKSLILSEEILINIYFSSDVGFKFTFDDFKLEYIDTEYEKGLTNFYGLFLDKVLKLKNTENRTELQERDWLIIKKLIGNPDALI